MSGILKSCLLIALTLMCCSEFFFPETGIPDNSSARRSTLTGVVDQLIEAYESRRIDLIDDLLADTFQFYVAPSFDEYYTLDYNSEPPDSSMQYIKLSSKTYFNYWKRKDELDRTKKLFEHTVSSEFIKSPHISRVRYEVSAAGDTLFAELQLDDGFLYLETDGLGTQLADINNQVFLLKRDSEGLWAIRKWYDLSTEKSTI
ncbi:MAG TPA: hypothetical protein VHO70_17785 [Chitinispirillaceae bacterium]|nr:hypothetical protein [Chitinispirillaceae bacterium]